MGLSENSIYLPWRIKNDCGFLLCLVSSHRLDSLAAYGGINLVTGDFNGLCKCECFANPVLVVYTLVQQFNTHAYKSKATKLVQLQLQSKEYVRILSKNGIILSWSCAFQHKS